MPQCLFSARNLITNTGFETDPTHRWIHFRYLHLLQINHPNILTPACNCLSPLTWHIPPYICQSKQANTSALFFIAYILGNRHMALSNNVLEQNELCNEWNKFNQCIVWNKNRFILIRFHCHFEQFLVSTNYIYTLTGDPLHNRALAHSRAPLFTQPCPGKTIRTTVCIYVAGLCARCLAV